MSDNKTQVTRASVTQFLNAVEDPVRRRDAKAVNALMKEITGEKPAMWGDALVGFGRYRYRYASGREGEWFLTGFSPRKQALSLYVMDGFGGHASLLKRLGRFKTGKACLHVKSLEDIDANVLRELLERSVAANRQRGS